MYGFSDLGIFEFSDFWIWGFFYFWELQGTDAAPRADGTGALQASEYERSSRRRYLTFVATALSNVRRDGVV